MKEKLAEMSEEELKKIQQEQEEAALKIQQTLKTHKSRKEQAKLNAIRREEALRKKEEARRLAEKPAEEKPAEEKPAEE